MGKIIRRKMRMDDEKVDHEKENDSLQTEDVT